MKQVMQNLRTGSIEIINAPNPPQPRKDFLQIRSSCSLISTGTERMLIDFARSGLINKARQQPEKVNMVYEKIKTDGITSTYNSVVNKLDDPIPLGYSNVGVVCATGINVSEFNIGDRVVSNGPHADLVTVSKNLSARIPDNVTDDSAAFTVVGAIALQGVRLAEPTIGENFVVIGLGLIGLLAVQILRAAGCNVLGMDYSKRRLEIASEYGAEILDLSTEVDPVAHAMRYSNNIGVDGVLITTATQSNEPIANAGKMSRKRGRIILVGVSGLDIKRDDFFKKEIRFQVSASYGPGRYDPVYEEHGIDYPIGFVRWTEKRNFEAILGLMSQNKINVTPLITNKFAFEEIKSAYDLIMGKQSDSIAILLSYTKSLNLDVFKKNEIKFDQIVQDKTTANKKRVVIGVIGCGKYAVGTLIPSFIRNECVLAGFASNNTIQATLAGKKFGVNLITSNPRDLIDNRDIDAVVITTRHDSHAYYVVEALRAGKHVYVEKPLCLSNEELDKVKLALMDYPMSKLTVGYNRRFSPHIQKIKSLLKNISIPKSLIMTVNSGAIAPDHWINNIEVGGGRLLGEGCHYIDLVMFVVDRKIIKYTKYSLRNNSSDTFSLQLEFDDGSIASIHYFSNGSKMIQKERLEIYVAEQVLRLDNFKKLYGYSWPKFKKYNLWIQDKGHDECVKRFIESIQTNSEPQIPYNEIFESTKIALDLSK